MRTMGMGGRTGRPLPLLLRIALCFSLFATHTTIRLFAMAAGRPDPGNSRPGNSSSFGSRDFTVAEGHAGSDGGQGEGVEPTADVPTAQKVFEFRSGFWINLHHFLYLQAVLATPSARKGHAEESAQAATTAPAMSSAQKDAWDKAVTFYRRFGDRDPLRDDELMRINYELSNTGNSQSLKGRRLSPELAAVLEQAAPVYRALWWTNHDRLNRAWIESAAKLVAEYGPAMSRRISRVFQTKWPAEPTPVEVVLYADWAGAYTTTNSTLITISSVDSGGQGQAALENLFHEASHALVGELQQRLDSDLRAVGKTPGFDIVHVIIFYTAGAVTLEALGKSADGFVPYAVKNGLYDRVPNWKHYREVCESDWQPYLDGRTTFDSALARIARDL